MSAPTLPPVLDVTAVMARYGLRDRRAARRLIDEAGGFYIAGRLVVRLDDLDAHELALRDARRAPADAVVPAPPRRPSGSGSSRRRRDEQLRPGWWRAADEED